MPVFGSLVSGYFLARYFPNARGSGIPQTKTALFLRDGYIRLPHRGGQIQHVLHHPGQRHRAGPRRSVGAGRRGHRFGAGAPAGAFAQERAGAAADRRGGGAGGGVQYADCGGAVHARRSDGRHARAGAGLDRAELGDFVDGAAPAAGRRTAVPRAGVPACAPGRVCVLRRAGPGRRTGFGGVREAAAVAAQAFPAIAQSDPAVSAGGGRLLVGAMGWFVPQVLGVGYGLCGPGAERPHADRHHGAAGGAEADRYRYLLRIRQRGRHLRPEPVHRRDAGRRGGGRGAPDFARLHRAARAPTRWWAWARRLPASCACR